MNHIILDLEFNTPYKTNYSGTIRNRDCPDEIMEIGAIKLDENFKQIDSFRMFIKPSYYKFVGRRVREKTGITIDDLITGGIEFTKAIDIFLKWIGEDSQLYTWSDNDYRTMRSNCDYYNISCKWFNDYIDLQEDYRIFTYEKQAKSLSKTLAELRIPIVKDTHTGLNDAIYTAEILKYMNGIDIRTISEDNIKKESDKDNCKEILCPVCNEIVKAEYENDGYSKTKKHFVLGICEKCNVPIIHTIERKAIAPCSQEFQYFTDTKIVKIKFYDDMKRCILKYNNKA